MTPNTTALDPFCAQTSPLIAELWRRWREDTEAWHDARRRQDKLDEARAQVRAHASALCLASIPAESLEDTEPKVLIVAWLRAYGDPSQAVPTIEASLFADMERLQPPFGTPLP